VIIYFGAYSFHRPDYLAKEFGAPEKTAIVLIVIGSILFLIAFFGCVGACFENQCMLTTFAILLVLGIVVELFAGGVILSYKTHVSKKIFCFF